MTARAGDDNGVLDPLEIDKRFEKVWQDIGWITGSFARCEAGLSQICQDLIGAGEAVGMALVGGKRWDELWNTLILLMKARNLSPDLITYVENARRRISAIKKFRDWLAHNSFFIAHKDGEPIVVIHKVNPRGNSEESTLKLSQKDLYTIKQHSMAASAHIAHLAHSIELGTIAESEISLAFWHMPPLPLSQSTNNRSTPQRPRPQP